MNIDEVESGKGLRFLPSEKACKSPDEIFNYPGTKHELQQRRVRARREKAQARIKRFLLIYPQAKKVMSTKIGRRNFIRIYVKD